MMEDTQIGIIGAGCWGTTLAALLAEKNMTVSLWDQDKSVIEELDRTRSHKRLRGLDIPKSIYLSARLDEHFNNCTNLLIAVPSRAFRTCCRELKEKKIIASNPRIVIATKGIEPETGMSMSSILEDELGGVYHKRMCVLSGPSHAEEVAAKKPTVVVAAAYDESTAETIQELFMTPYFRVYRQSDVIGVETGAAIKNVIAIAAGICDGLELGDNAKAALLTRGLAEIIRLGVAMGGKIETYSGLSGIGDLIVTATSRHSRNRNFGEYLARGLTLEQALERIGMVVEGVTTVLSVIGLAKKHNIEMPISLGVYAVVYEGASPRELARELMQRSPKSEIYGL